MSRTGIMVIFGGLLGLVVGIMVVAAFLFGSSLFRITDSQTTFDTPAPVVVVATPTSGIAPVTASPTNEPTAAATTAVPTTGPTQAVPTNAPVETITVSSTSVQYIQAQGDVNIRSGPGTGYNIIGFVAGGQTAKVTGVHTATGWWRVECPNGSIGSCWVTGNAQFTKPVSSPVNTVPTATPTSAACTDIAELVLDVTVPDNTQLTPNTGFNKTWRLKNAGTCTWNNNYKIVHAGGSLMGAIASAFPLNQTVVPGQTADITISMVSPATTGTHTSNWKLQNEQGKVFGIGPSGNSFFVKIIVTDPALNVTISGVVYQDWNENGVYDFGETLMGSREVWLIPGTACHVAREVVTAVAYSGADGVYTFKGNYSGNYCVGLAGGDGLDDVRAVTVSSGQVITNLNLRSLVPSSSISGYVWNDFCRLSNSSSVPEGNCVADGTGGYVADGMVQPTEGYIQGVTVLLQLGACGNNSNVPVSAVTDASGRYLFSSLLPGTYCVYIEATAPVNQAILLPGLWTFPQLNVWYQQLTLVAGANAYSVNFGWDYQFN